MIMDNESITEQQFKDVVKKHCPNLYIYLEQDNYDVELFRLCFVEHLLNTNLNTGELLYCLSLAVVANKQRLNALYEQVDK